MKDSRVKTALQAIARRGVPDDTNLWPRIQSRMPKGPLPMNWQTKWSWSLVWLILALVLLTTAAYALYHYLYDPGLQSAQDAGLFTDMNTTAEPNLLTPAPPFASGSGAATRLNVVKTQAGLTMTLDWVYLEYARQAIHVTVDGLGPDMRIGVPQLTFAGATPQSYSGAILSLEGDGPIQATYLVHQMVDPGGQPPLRFDTQIDVPVTAWNEGKPSPVTTFHFDVPDLEITMPFGGGGSNTYAVQVNGLEMRMQHVVFAPDYTEVRLCYQNPSPGEWAIKIASAQFGDPPALAPGAGVAMGMQAIVATDSGDTCRDVDFPIAAPGRDVSFYVTVDGIAQTGSAETIDNRWEFSTYLPGDLHIGGVAAPSTVSGPPLASETVDDLTATLLSAYIDSNRMAFTVHFDDWQPSFSVSYVSLRLPDGTEVNAGANWGPAEADPATAVISLTPVTALKMERFQGQLVLNLHTSLAPDAPTTEFKFDLDLPVYEALTIEPMLKANAADTDVILQMVKTSPSYTVVYVCYRKPAAGDWMLGDPVTLQIGPDQVGINDYAMLYDPEYRDTGKGTEPGWQPAMPDGRCVRAGFPVGHHGKPETLVLSIGSLQLSLPEVQDPDAVKRALEVLRDQGIEMDYMTFTGSGGGGGGPVFKKLPEGMTGAEANQRFLEALGYVHKGPWVFTLELKP